jgi:hypothetical protein
VAGFARRINARRKKSRQKKTLSFRRAVFFREGSGALQPDLRNGYDPLIAAL